MPPIIQIQNLTKKFGNLAAVDHLDLEIEEGEILGLLGPNGAGKTTAILMLATVIKPTEGTALVGGFDIRKSPDKVRGLLGIAFQEPKMLWVATPWDVVNWHAKVCGLSTEERKQRVKQVLETLDMWEPRHKNVHALSGGMRKRVEMAKVLIQRPKIAIVDEPTTQIDIVGKHKIWNMLLELRDEGSTIILATNELYEADRLSDRVCIMHRGKLLVCDTPKTLKDSILGGDIIDIQLEKDASPTVVEELKSFKEVVDIMQVKPTNLRLYLNRVEEVVPQIMNLLMKKNVPINSIRMSEPSLDDVFAHYTGLTIEEAQKDEG
ncbi:ATP-binding cassette domain-containing protein [Candidatus Bathyarchaeota archaeon]|jgi:ABC-2 type transport system ATP-binding protein|nr:ATP-binding cassette domain-containing protein [Candidatus Bathyarchaeota archaeon]